MVFELIKSGVVFFYVRAFHFFGYKQNWVSNWESNRCFELGLPNVKDRKSHCKFH